MQVEARRELQVSCSIILCLLPLRQGLSLSLKLKPQGASCLCPSQHTWLKVLMATPRFCFCFHGCWDPKPGPHATQQVILPTEPSFQHHPPAHLSTLSPVQSPLSVAPHTESVSPLGAFVHCVPRLEPCFPSPLWFLLLLSLGGNHTHLQRYRRHHPHPIAQELVPRVPFLGACGIF